MPAFTMEDAGDAVRATFAIAHHIRSSIDRMREVTKDDRSPVTVADFAVQASIRLSVDRVDPSLPIVGEERADLLREPDRRATLEAVVDAVRLVHPNVTTEDVLAAVDGCAHDATAETYLALDPIDGTKGFLRGGQFATAFALLRSGDVIWGILGCPALNPDVSRDPAVPHAQGCLLLAERGCGTEQRGADGTPSDRCRVLARQPADPIRICESAESAHSDQSASAELARRQNVSASFIRVDSQCKYAIVARGQADAYLRLPTRADYQERIWDHAAGMIVASEAGAKVSDIDGKPLDFGCGTSLARNRGVICTHPDLHAGIIETLQSMRDGSVGAAR